MTQTDRTAMGSERTSGDAAPQDSLLERVHSHADLAALPRAELPRLCAQIRAFLLESVQRTGGHLGSNLGTVEISVALHQVFDFRRDRLVFDVSHQCYAHKLLTGRRARFDRLRMSGGPCGFTHPDESPQDLFHTGHAGTAISLGLGLALAGQREGEAPHVISLVGDAALGAGVAFEALNHAAASGARLLVVLNDNEWSISRSVGGLARYLSRLRSSRLLQRAGQEVGGLIQSIPVIGKRLDRTLGQLGEVMRHAVVPGHVFEELGVIYVGPLDGHDVHLLVENLERVKDLEGTVLLHILTEKGRGHPKATTHPERVHGVKASEPPLEPGTQDGKLAPATAAAACSGPAYTEVFGRALCELAARDVRVHAITAAMRSGTGLDEFAERFPARFHDTGITEQHACAMAAGMAKGGLRPVLAIYSTFLQRGYDQVFQEIALQNLPVVLALDRAGLVGADGPTHNGVFDLAYLRTLPGLVLAAPRDATDLERALELALRLGGPFALRFPRAGTPGAERIHRSERAALLPGRAEVLLEPGEIVIWAYGALVHEALEAAERCARRGLDVGVVDARFCKPLDTELLFRHAQSCRHIVTLEEHQRMGGFGSAVLEALAQIPGALARAKLLAVPDRWVEHRTTRAEQLAELSLDADGVERVVRALAAPSRV